MATPFLPQLRTAEEAERRGASPAIHVVVVILLIVRSSALWTWAAAIIPAYWPHLLIHTLWHLAKHSPVTMHS